MVRGVLASHQGGRHSEPEYISYRLKNLLRPSFSTVSDSVICRIKSTEPALSRAVVQVRPNDSILSEGLPNSD